MPSLIQTTNNTLKHIWMHTVYTTHAHTLTHSHIRTHPHPTHTHTYTHTLIHTHIQKMTMRASYWKIEKKVLRRHDIQRRQCHRRKKVQRKFCITSTNWSFNMIRDKLLTDRCHRTTRRNWKMTMRFYTSCQEWVVLSTHSISKNRKCFFSGEKCCSNILSVSFCFLLFVSSTLFRRSKTNNKNNDKNKIGNIIRSLDKSVDKTRELMHPWPLSPFTLRRLKSWRSITNRDKAEVLDERTEAINVICLNVASWLLLGNITPFFSWGHLAVSGHDSQTKRCLYGTQLSWRRGSFSLRCETYSRVFFWPRL